MTGRWFRQAMEYGLSLIYPRYCQLCRTSTQTSAFHSLCQSCADNLQPPGSPACDCCHEPFSGALSETFTCPNCRDQSYAFSYNRSALRYSDEASSLISDFKYRKHIYLARDLAALMAPLMEQIIENEGVAPQNWCLVPVPLHPKRESWRNFNQAREICRFLSKNTDISTQEALRRVINTSTQTRLSRSQRQKNLKHAFKIKKRALSPLKTHILLIDDVFTTGSTANACAKSLIDQSGTEKVIVLTAMRG